MHAAIGAYSAFYVAVSSDCETEFPYILSLCTGIHKPNTLTTTVFT